MVMLLLSDLTLGVNESVSSALLKWCNMEEQASHGALTKASSSATGCSSACCWSCLLELLAWITGCRMQLVGQEESRWWVPIWTASELVVVFCDWHLQRNAAKHANLVRGMEITFWYVCCVTLSVTMGLTQLCALQSWKLNCLFSKKKFCNHGWDFCFNIESVNIYWQNIWTRLRTLQQKLMSGQGFILSCL